MAVVLVVLTAAGCSHPAPEVSNEELKPAAAPPFLALRLAFADSAAGRERVQYGDTAAFLDPDVIMSDDDLLAVDPHTGPRGELALRVRYRPEAGQRLTAATGSHVGEQLALMLDDRVWNLSRIASAVGRGGDLTVATSATGADAERLATEVRSRWPSQ